MTAPSWDLIVVANPVWETAWRLERLPSASFDPNSALERVEDGGGSALNTACALAMAGRRVLAVGRVGDDPEGHGCIEALERRGVVPAIERAPGRATKRNHLYVERDSAATAFEAFLPPHCVPAWEEDPHPILDAAILWLDRLAVRAPVWLQERKKVPGLRNGLNRNSPTFRGPSSERVRAALPNVDILQIPEGGRTEHAPPEKHEPAVRGTIHSPAAMPPLTDDEVASVFAMGVSLLLRTRGDQGVLIQARGDAPLVVPAIPTEVIDPTGAGDAFSAGFIDAVLDGASIADAARRGVDWAARACRHLGARGWLDVEPPERK
jgi:sugar/nucleoside kinase (ribokinase family)